MTDIYRQELAIPEKRKAFGWLMLAGGGIMLLIAIFLYYTEITQVKKYEVRPWDQTAQKMEPSQKNKTVINTKALIERARPLTWIMLVTVLLLITFLVGAAINHHLAQRLRASTERKKREETILTDPWKEAGERFQMDQDDRKE